MDITLNRKEIKALGGPSGPPGPVRRWAAFAAGIFLIWLFMFVIAPWLQRSPAIKPLADFVNESGINASALYYTGVEEVGDADMNIRSTMTYMPRGNQKD